jgi:hypothetical protein
MAKLLRILLPCALGIAAALLVACGDTSGLIPSNDASQINQNIDAAAEASSSGRCTRAGSAVERALAHVNQLPSSVDPRLKARLIEGLRKLEATAATECTANKTDTTTTETATTDTATTDTATTDTATTDTTPTETQPTETQPTETQPTETQPTDTGGDGTGGTGTGPGGGTPAP